MRTVRAERASQRRFSLVLAGLAFAGCTLGAPRARADLGGDAAEIARGWTARGFAARRLAPMFLEHGRARGVQLSAASSRSGGEHGCTTVAFLATRSTDFVVKVEPVAFAKHLPIGGRVERSVAGGVFVSECGPAREALERITVEVRAARSALEVIVATGESAPPRIAEVLPARASGPVASPVDLGPRPPPDPLSARASRAEQRARDVGATSVQEETFMADSDGTGREVVRLGEGCHRIELFADVLGQRPLDLDAELREVQTERLLGRDRSDAVDARLDLCAGSTLGAGLLFAGAPGPVKVLWVDTLFPLPRGVPTTWGARARAGLASALWRRKAPVIESDPIEQTLGAAGLTRLHVATLPGTCYVAAVALTRGEARSVALDARTDSRTSFDAAAGLNESAAVAFCSVASSDAALGVDVRGGTAAWVLAVWQVGPLGDREEGDL